MSFTMQELIHRSQSGGGWRFFRVLFVLILVSAAASLYDTLLFRNFSNREAMDMAQLGRNLAEGRGYTTLMVRPLSMALLQRHRPDRSPLLKTAHPDLANPPVYPYLLAGLFKIIPAKYFVTPEKGFAIYLPELAVALVNQVLVLVAGLLLFFLAQRLLDSTMAWVTSVVFVGSEVVWRFSVSGLNTMLLLVLVLAVAWCLVLLDHWSRLGRGDTLLGVMALLAGLLVGTGGLTRYAFGWLIVPVAVYLFVFFERNRAALVLAALAGFLVVLAPWMLRNYSLSGLPFGTATLATWENTDAFQEDHLQRSLHPDLRTDVYKGLGRKILHGTRELVENDLPKLGGSWVSAFFLVGLLVPFRSPALARLRWLLLFSLAVFAAAQVLGRTFLAVESPQINSDNLLVLLAPLVFMYGVALFFLLLDSVASPVLGLRPLLISGFCLMAALPLLLKFIPPHPAPVAYPPYYPPLIQRVCGWYNQQELLMSDMPWAVAWYGRRQCLLTTLNWRRDFLEITDLYKPIKGIYLTPLTTDTPFLSNWVRGENRSWGAFLLESLSQREVPPGFPLRRAPDGFFPEQVLLTDYDRWKLKPDQPAGAAPR
jgi:4-amino-4-deoxy-L-arabinose transferase-like glycosyltransferase